MTLLGAVLWLWLAPLPVQAAQAPVAVFTESDKARDQPVRYAQAIVLSFGTTFFTEVKISTNGAVLDLSRLAHEGFYKRELITLLLVSAKGGKPLDDLAARRRKGESLKKLAVSCGLDYEAVSDAAVAVEKIVDRDYLPHFPERRPKLDRAGDL